jgi:hypothetical protein
LGLAFSPGSTSRGIFLHGHSLPLRREELSNLGSGGMWECGTVGSETGLVAACLFRVNTRPRKPIATKIAPAIINQCAKLIDESRAIYFAFAFSDGTITWPSRRTTFSTEQIPGRQK